MKDLILGTVQLGMSYGINNTTGQPDQQSSFSILDYAHSAGVLTLDTAAAYGSSQDVIGAYIKQKKQDFRICTKLDIALSENYTQEQYPLLEQAVHFQCTKLGVDSLSCLYLHHFNMCQNADLMAALEKLKASGLTVNRGVSIYYPEEFEYIIQHLCGKIEVVQIPFNVLNAGDWLHNNLLERAKAAGFTIYVRSIFLQGLFMKSPDAAFCRNLGATPYLQKIHEEAVAVNCSIPQFCFNFVGGFSTLDACIVGCETLPQLQQNVAYWQNAVPFDSQKLKAIVDGLGSVPRSITDPSQWKTQFARQEGGKP